MAVNPEDRWFGTTCAGFAEAFGIFSKYSDETWAVRADHDEIWSAPDAALVSDADEARLAQLGWLPSHEGGFVHTT